MNQENQEVKHVPKKPLTQEQTILRYIIAGLFAVIVIALLVMIQSQWVSPW